MKVKALGTNAHLEFDGSTVRITPRGGMFDRSQVALYPIETVIGIQVTEALRQPDRPGTFQLVVDPRDTSLIPPFRVEYPYYARHAFATLTEEIDASLARLGRPPYIPAPVMAPVPGSYTVTAPTPVPALPALPVPAAPVHPAVSSTWDLAGQITQLAQLRDAGVLTAAEFETAKARLLRMVGGVEPNDAVA